MKKPLHLIAKNKVCALSVFLMLLSLTMQAQSIEFGKSYINITKGNGGGTVETGDTLEIRASFTVRNNSSFDSCAFYDTIPAGTEYIPGTVRVLTNEGKIYKQFTDAAGDDEGRFGSTHNNVQINLGYNQTAAPATRFRRGRVAYNHRPRIYSSTCIMIASYRVRVTAALNTYIFTGGGTFTYKPSGPVQIHRFPNNRVFVYTNYGICTNSVGANALGTEFNGTFGSGKARNRGTSANVPSSYTYATFTSNSPQDYYYGIPNNTSISTGYTTSNDWPNPDGTHRVFRLWDIIGDHTGAADPEAGNPAADTVANDNAGYMLVINAAYRIDSAFQQTISNLCPNTYYEVSVWMRNICSRCGCDSTGKSADTQGYLPTAPGDSSGVYPNLTFEIDGTDYYTTGNLLYTGKWVKKGFVFRTGPAQTSFTLKLFNNAPGGGGNDWALDDISVATCSPNLTVNPETDPVFCDDNVISMGSTVRSFFNNYTEYKWQRSTDNGTSWAELPVAGTASPAMNSGAWEYSVDYPSFVGSRADSGHKYRMVVATTSANLNDAGCAFFSSTSVLTLHVESCTVLSIHFLSFSGATNGSANRLQWSISDEEEPAYFEIEHSWNGTRFSPVAKVPYTIGQYFSWQEPTAGAAPYYRVVMVLQNGTRITAPTVILNTQPVSHLSVETINPFQNNLAGTLSVARAGLVQLKLFDHSGRLAWQKTQHLEKGRHQVFQNLPVLSDGVYFLIAESGNEVVRKKLIKQNAP